MATDATHPDSLYDRFREAVQAACNAMAGEEVGTGTYDFDGIGTPSHFAEAGASIDVVEPELDSVEWWVAETYEGGTQVGNVEVDASVSFDGYVHKSHVHNVDLTVLQFDWNEHYAWCAFTAGHAWRLRWSYQVDPGDDPELEFEGVVEPLANPHSLR